MEDENVKNVPEEDDERTDPCSIFQSSKITPRTPPTKPKIESINISDDNKLESKFEVVTYKPHPVIMRLKHVQSEKKIEDCSNNGTETSMNANCKPSTEDISADKDPFTMFSNIVERLEHYYEEKLKIEVSKLKIHFEKEMLDLLQHHQQPLPRQYCCNQSGKSKNDDMNAQLQSTLNSMNQINMNLQKRNMELTEQLMTLMMSFNKQDVDDGERFRSRKNSARSQSEKRNSHFCVVM